MFDKQFIVFAIRFQQLSSLLVSSVMLPTAVGIFPRITSPLSAGGMFKLRSNVSDCSAISSIVTGTLIVVLSSPAVKVAVIGVEV